MEENTINIIEAVMFALGREISIDELSNTLMIDKENVEEAIKVLTEKFSGNSGIIMVKVKDMYQLVTNKDYYSQVNKFIEKEINPKSYTITINNLDDITETIEIYNITNEFVNNKDKEQILSDIMKNKKSDLLDENNITFKHLN